MALELQIHSVDVENHLASFKFRGLDAYINNINVNTQIEYSDDESTIIIPGSLLSSGEDSELTAVVNSCTFVPNDPNHINTNVAQLAQAKTE